MAPAPDTNVFDSDAESDGNGSELIRVDDEDDVGLLPGEFAVPISVTTLIYLLELAKAHRVTHGSWLDESDSESESIFDSGAGSETNSDSDEIPDLIPSKVADQCFTRYTNNAVVAGSNNDVSDLLRQVWIDGCIFSTRVPRNPLCKVRII